MSAFLNHHRGPRLGLLSLGTLIILGLMLGGPIQVAAEDGTCYTAAEFSAEQGLRLQNELLVIALRCKRFGESNTVMEAYRSFEQRHLLQLKQWEWALLGHFERVGAPEPKRTLATMLTAIGNQLSHRSNQFQLERYCAPRISMLDAMAGLDPSVLEQEIRSIPGNAESTKPLCP